MPLLSKASNVVQNVFFLYDVIYRLYSNWPFDSCRNQLQDPTSLGSVLRSSEFTTAT